MPRGSARSTIKAMNCCIRLSYPGILLNGQYSTPSTKRQAMLIIIPFPMKNSGCWDACMQVLFDLRSTGTTEGLEF